MQIRRWSKAHLVPGAGELANLKGGGHLVGLLKAVPGVHAVGGPQHEEVVSRSPHHEVAGLHLLHGLQESNTPMDWQTCFGLQ